MNWIAHADFADEYGTRNSTTLHYGSTPEEALAELQRCWDLDALNAVQIEIECVPSEQETAP